MSAGALSPVTVSISLRAAESVRLLDPVDPPCSFWLLAHLKRSIRIRSSRRELLRLASELEEHGKPTNVLESRATREACEREAKKIRAACA